MNDLPLGGDLPIGDDLPHEPVLYHEIIHALQPTQDGRYVDCTLGAGGHAWGILQASRPSGRLLGLDVDPQAIDLASQRLSGFGQRATIVRASYTTLKDQLSELSWEAVSGILLDLGASSMQFDSAERGFSFRVDSPLDMRFNPENPTNAADLVNDLSESELADLLFAYGDEKRSRQIARAIVKARPVETTGKLAEIVAQVFPSGRRSIQGRGSAGAGVRIHPATRTFQALRIAVNKELEALELVLPQAVSALAPGGRLAVISFHSLEDRIVKQFFRRESKNCICPPRQPVCTCGHHAVLIEITRRPIQPQPAETDQNPRARSARLRVVEKIEKGT